MILSKGLKDLTKKKLKVLSNKFFEFIKFFNSKLRAMKLNIMSENKQQEERHSRQKEIRKQGNMVACWQDVRAHVGFKVSDGLFNDDTLFVEV